MSDHVKMTAVDRLNFDFAKLAGAPGSQILSQSYLERLISQEDANRERVGKRLRALLVLISAGISYLAGARLEASAFNWLIEIPAAAEILVFLLGVSFAGFIYNIINVLILHRIHRGIVRSLLESETPWLAVMELDSRSIWTDLAMLRQLTPASGSGHRLFSAVFNWFSLIIFATVGLVALIVMTFLTGRIASTVDAVGYVPPAVALAGVVMAIASLIYLIFAFFVRYRFTLPIDASKP